MTNIEKAVEIARSNYQGYHIALVDHRVKRMTSESECYRSAKEMAKWKDNEFKKHNDELIDKACEIYKKELNTMNHIVRLITSDPQNLIEIDESVEEFRKLLKIECYEKKR